MREFKEPEFDHAPASLVIEFSQAAFSILWATQQLRFSSKVKDIVEKKVRQSVCRSLLRPFASKLFCRCINYRISNAKSGLSIGGNFPR